MKPFLDLFGGVKPILGMIHLAPLPGSPSAPPTAAAKTLDALLAQAARDAEILTAAGVDGMIVENFGDAPFVKEQVAPITVGAMAIVCRELRRDHNVPLGVNVLRNDAAAAVSIAALSAADFVRVNVHVGAVVADQGVIEGRARETLLLRRALGAQLLLFADVGVKHSQPLGATGPDHLLDEARDARLRGLADALILSGSATGSVADPEEFRRVKEALPDTPLLVGSGVSAENVAAFWPVSDGMIVGSAMKKNRDARQEVDPEAARTVLEAAASLKRAEELQRSSTD